MFVSAKSDDPARRPRRVLRVGRAARRPAAARAAGDRRRRRRARRELRGQGATASAPRWAARQARRLCPHAVVGPAAHVGLLRGEQGGVRGVRGHDAARRGALDRRGVPRRPRAASEVSGTPAEIAARLRRDVLERVGLPITVGVARTKFLAKVASARGQARRAARRAARRRARVPPPAAGRAALGRRAGDRRASCATAGSRPSARSRGCGEAALVVACSAAPRAGTSTRSPTTAIRGRCRSAAGAARSARSARSAARRRRAEALDAVARRARRPGHAPAARRRPRRPHRRRCGCASTTSRARPGRTRSPGATAQTARRSSRPRAACSPTATPMIERRGLTLVGVAVAQPRRRPTRSSSTLPFDRRSDGALDAALDERARALRLDRGHARRAARPRPGALDAVAPRLTTTYRSETGGVHDRSYGSRDRNRGSSARCARKRGRCRSHHPLRLPDDAVTTGLEPLGRGRRCDLARRTGDLRHLADSQAREDTWGGAARPPRRAGRHRQVRRPQRTLARAPRRAGLDRHDRHGDRSCARRRRVAGLPRRIRLRARGASRQLRPADRHRVLRQHPAPSSRRLGDVQPRRRGRLRCSGRRDVLTVDGAHGAPRRGRRPDGDAAGVPGRRRLDDAELRRPSSIRCQRRDVVPRDATGAPRIRPTVRHASELRRRAPGLARGAGKRDVRRGGTSTEPRGACRRTTATGRSRGASARGSPAGERGPRRSARRHSPASRKSRPDSRR